MSAATELGPWMAEVLDEVPFSALRQVVAHDPPRTYGDCFRTVVACLIGADQATEVPHFVADNIARDGEEGDPQGWHDLRDARLWLRLTLDYDLFPLSHDVADEMGVRYKSSILSPSGVVHSVVGQRGRVVWCPAGYPTEPMVMNRTESAWVISRPYSPTPAEMVAEWRAALGEQR